MSIHVPKVTEIKKWKPVFKNRETISNIWPDRMHHDFPHMTEHSGAIDFLERHDLIANNSRILHISSGIDSEFIARFNEAGYHKIKSLTSDDFRDLPLYGPRNRFRPGKFKLIHFEHLLTSLAKGHYHHAAILAFALKIFFHLPKKGVLAFAAYPDMRHNPVTPHGDFIEALKALEMEKIGSSSHHEFYQKTTDKPS